jgi:hypothetical protein
MIDKDMYEQWLHHPCTKELKKQLETRRSQLINRFIGGGHIFLNGCDPLAVFSRDSGRVDAYQTVLDVISCDIVRELFDPHPEEDSKNA